MFRDSKQLLDFLVKGYDFKTSMIDTCYNFAKFQYECGNYSGASEYLYFHRILVQVSPELVNLLYCYTVNGEIRGSEEAECLQ